MWWWLRGAGNRSRIAHGVERELLGVRTRADLDACIARGREGCEPLAARTWARTRAAGPETFRIVQFNTLARGLSSGPSAPTPFPAAEPSSFGGFDAIASAETTLDWSSRRWSLLAELLRHDGDVITLQEVDHFSDFFEPALAAAGYDVLFQPAAAPSAGEKFGYHTDGVVLAWKRSRFSLGRVNSMRASVAGRASIIATLLPAPAAPTTRPLVVATAHLNAKPGQEREDLRAAQLAQLVAQIDRARAAAGGSPVVVLAGDFNTDPHDVSLPKPHVAKVLPSLLRHGFVSAYPLARAESAHAAGTNMWTTWKRRGSHEVKHQIGYICTIGADSVARLLPPSDDALANGRLPSPYYPSDHIAISADCEPAQINRNKT
jgi:nocturnin